MTRAAVVGATGYAGAELVRILAGHPSVELTALASRSYAGVPFSRVYPAMAGVVDMACEALDVDALCQKADVIFTALPHKLPMAVAPQFLEKGRKVVDLSADFRFRDPALYEAHYQPHTARDVLENAVYGLSEIYADEIRNAGIVGNPGCYPTSVLLPLVPLVRAKLVDASTIIADAKSGVSGAGRSPSLTTIFCEVNESFKAYKVAAHRHNPEMEEVLSLAAGFPVRITFVPHLVPMSRGMLTTIYADMAEGTRADDVRNCLHAAYGDAPFVRLLEDGRVPDALHVRGTNFCDIGVRADARRNRLILISAIDNLVKGAAGQAVQNMNIMLGLDETAGLRGVPFPL